MDALEALRPMVVWPDAQEADYPYPPGVWVGTGEGGLFAYAAIEADDALLSSGRGPHGCVVSSFLSLSLDDNLVGGTDIFDPQDGGARFHSSAPLLGAVFLGMTGASLWRAGADRQMGTYFEAGEADLDQRGATVIAALRAAHGRPVAIITLLDT